mmetsp:Transcript_40040/g.105859  ORF Transcript_40040/g.105859 Transcript_40040/m.105859 type:complete len:240 (-) Transcript_40040:299-1018(-)
MRRKDAHLWTQCDGPWRRNRNFYQRARAWASERGGIIKWPDACFVHPHSACTAVAHWSVPAASSARNKLSRGALRVRNTLEFLLHTRSGQLARSMARASLDCWPCLWRVRSAHRSPVAPAQRTDRGCARGATHLLGACKQGGPRLPRRLSCARACFQRVLIPNARHAPERKRSRDDSPCDASPSRGRRPVAGLRHCGCVGGAHLASALQCRVRSVDPCTGPPGADLRSAARGADRSDRS